MIRTRLKHGTGCEFRDEVVIVGVKPLGHLQRRLLRRAPCECEIGVKVDYLSAKTETPGYRAQQHGHVEHVVVERKITDRDSIEAAFPLQPPMLLAQVERGFL